MANINEIIEGLLKAAKSSDMTQEERDVILRAFTSKIAEETDSDVEISYIHKKGEDSIAVRIEGNHLNVEFGMCRLLRDIVMGLGGNDKEKAIRELKRIYEYVEFILNKEEGANDTQDCAEKAED